MIGKPRVTGYTSLGPSWGVVLARHLQEATSLNEVADLGAPRSAIQVLNRAGSHSGITMPLLGNMSFKGHSSQRGVLRQ